MSLEIFKYDTVTEILGGVTAFGTVVVVSDASSGYVRSVINATPVANAWGHGMSFRNIPLVPDATYSLLVKGVSTGVASNGKVTLAVGSIPYKTTLVSTDVALSSTNTDVLTFVPEDSLTDITLLIRQSQAAVSDVFKINYIELNRTSAAPASSLNKLKMNYLVNNDEAQTIRANKTFTSDIDVLNRVKQSGVNLVPVGAIFAYAATDAPSGYLRCNGAAVSKTTYADLFSVIGNTYGNSDGTNFNVPNYISRTLVGFGTSDSRFDTLNEQGTIYGFASDSAGSTKNLLYNVTNYIIKY